jgi:hypothetical protein
MTTDNVQNCDSYTNKRNFATQCSSVTQYKLFDCHTSRKYYTYVDQSESKVIIQLEECFREQFLCNIGANVL